MAEIESKGIKGVKKLLWIFPLIGTILGILWGAFEFYKDYMDMKEQITKYVAPDLSGFDKKLGLLNERMIFVEDSVGQARDYTRDIKVDLKNDIAAMETQIDDIERRGKDAFKLVRGSIETNDAKVRALLDDQRDQNIDNLDQARSQLDRNITAVRDSITEAETRFDTRREQIRGDMDLLETRLTEQMETLEDTVGNKIQKALENPLANMRK
jgi:hypothetical protein